MNTPNRVVWALVLGLMISPLAAQDLDLGTSGVEEPPPDDEKPYDPSLPYSSENDPGTDLAPKWEDVLGDALPLDPSLIETIDRLEGLPDLEPGDTPFPAALDCSTFTTVVDPLKLWGRNQRYFSFAGRPKILVGVSADNGCALVKPPGAIPEDQVCSHRTTERTECRFDTHSAILADAAARGLNRTRLWVVLPSEPIKDNHIFAWDAGRGVYRLDIANGNYLDRLRTVVDRAKQLNMFVEVTFFSPGTSVDNPPNFDAGPWGGFGRYSTPRGQVGSGVTLRVASLAEQGDMVRATASDATEDPTRKLIQEFQKNVVDWVVDALWCYDNVWWEVANEPEGLIGKSLVNLQPSGFPTADEIANWQKRVVGWIRAAEARHVTYLPSGHPIAVNPLTTRGRVLLIDHPQISVLDGHYTTVAFDTQNNDVDLDLGTIQLLRGHRTTTNRLFGMNEDKITPWPNVHFGRNQTHEAHRNTVDSRLPSWGAIESARAGAWEAMFHQAGTVDLFGYCYTSPEGKETRNQLGKLREFMITLPLANLRPAPLLDTSPPRWLPDLTVYPIDHANWETQTGSSKYWAALETADTATGRTFVAYFHHSAPRCKGVNQDFVPPNLSACNRNQLTYQGYDARIKTNGYRERLRLDLGAAPGTFLVEWKAPATLLNKATRTIVWNPVGGGTCTGSVQTGTCVVESPDYDYDLVLKVSQQ